MARREALVAAAYVALAVAASFALFVVLPESVAKRTTLRFRGIQHWRVRLRPGIYELYALQDVFGLVLRYPKQWKFAVVE
jgi:hypothetical protein